MDNNDEKKSPKKVKLKVGTSNATASDSDASLETNVSADSARESTFDQNQTPSYDKIRKNTRRDSEWAIIGGLKEGQRFDRTPTPFTGYLHKKRKWPLKGWHKRYFVLDKGILVYGKGPSEINKGKIHGTLDIGLSVITTKANRRRIDIDAEEYIYHLKAKTDDDYASWVEELTEHRLYRQHTLTYGTNVGTGFRMGFMNLFRNSRIQDATDKPAAGKKGKSSDAGRVGVWVKESLATLERFQIDASVAEQDITKLSSLLQQIECCTKVENTVCDVLCMPNVKKDRRKFGLKKKKSSKGSSIDLTSQLSGHKCPASVDIDNTSTLSAHMFPAVTCSPTLNANSSGFTLPVPANAPSTDNLSNADGVSLSAENQMRDEFVVLAKEVFVKLKTLTDGLSMEREKLKTALDEEALAHDGAHVSNQNIVNLKNNLNQVLQQNADLKKRLVRIHEVSDVELDARETPRTDISSVSYSSSCVSATEFFDAEDLPEDKSKDGEDESEAQTKGSENSSETISSGGGSSSDSELAVDLTPVISLGEGQVLSGRRTVLPAPRPPTEGLSLWNLLSKNIGKDLSKISMPVALNEPLNVLQRLCESLEYSELLDEAANIDDPYDRMVKIAAFAVSEYASTLSRAGSKPFNPLQGETYECIREDKGFRFISEQVSHHPPVGTCFAESDNFTYWQDTRIKTKFWGKSMEFQPIGNVHVQLRKTGDHYTWNKVTTCVHNLFSGQRWVDQYGELKITNETITCNLTFSKASYWSSKIHEVSGEVYDESGTSVRQLYGTWSEALYCGADRCGQSIWRAHPLPVNHERYYGFTRFAIELNELGPDAHLLPPTDTRFRPDQKALENGDLITAEAVKHQLETAQRERRKRREELGLEYEARWFSPRPDDTWEYNGKYWDMRKDPGFANMEFESLW